ncbi:Na/Pi symporter [bacterium]|nr:Na/Pi symporter [bacterium]RQV93252.1 MAG: hypothetical protein EH221_09770 [bacterium]
MSSETRLKITKAFLLILSVYLFLLSINLLGHSFKLFGKGFAESMIRMTSNPFAGLLIGVVSTSLIQSSSTTTSIVVGLVAGDALSLYNAIPIIMGANIGTTITNTLVSMGHVSNRIEFQRAFSASIVHDFFNILAVLVLFPIELRFHLLAKVAIRLESYFAGSGGMEVFNPLKVILDPVIQQIEILFTHVPFTHIVMMVVSLVLLFSALTMLIKTIRSLVLSKIEIVINKYLFRNDTLGFILGVFMTSIVQSSSVTTSLIIPLAGAGLVSIRQIFPYTLGSNIGTTVTAIMAALVTQNDIAVTVAFAHLCFNILGVMVFYPLRFIPIKLAEFIGRKASKSKRNLVLFVTIYISLHFIFLIFIFVH